MAARFRFDFSTVRIHADPQAGESAKQVGASAYTVGQHVVFSAGRYDRETRNGGPLLAHELAHVVQQRARPSGSEHIAMLDAPATEAEANGAARLVTMNQHPSVTQFAAGAPVLQRQKPQEGTPTETKNPDTMPMGMYVDAYDAAYYDIDYKSVKGGLSKWIKVSYSYGGSASTEINIDDISDATEDAAQMVQDMFDHVGAGGRVFPKQMNRSTTPQLWQAKQHVLRIMDDYNALFILGGAFPTVWMILTMGIGAAGGARGGRGSSTVRRPLGRGRMPGAGGKQAPPETESSPGGTKQGEAAETTEPQSPARVAGAKAPGPVPKYADGRAVWGQGPEDAQHALRDVEKNGLPASGGSRENLQAWQRFYSDAITAGKGGTTAPMREELMRRMIEMMGRSPPGR